MFKKFLIFPSKPVLTAIILTLSNWPDRQRRPRSDYMFYQMLQNAFVCVEALWPSQPNGVMSFYLTTHLLGRLSPLSG